jgi:hypothetical protein
MRVGEAKMDAKTVFRQHYETNAWGCDESVSGDGSTLEYTQNIRMVIPQLVAELDINNILDAPCGDYNWFQMIQWAKPIHYVGGDIVEDLIKRNQTLYTTEYTKFRDLDIVHDDLPKADLWLCRDCLFHLSDREVFLALDNFIKSDIPYMLTSTYSESEFNHDIPTGTFRLLNLLLPPFSLGQPIRLIDDWIEGYAVRHLALWEREAVKAALANNPVYQAILRDR